MIIRRLKENDVFQHERVASQAFVYDCDVDSKENTLPCEFMLGAFCDDNKTLMADMEIEHRACIFGKNKLSCAAVGGVASKPEFRNKGAVRKIFESLFNEEIFNNNAEISILYPFSAAYYRKFGYETVGRAVEVKVPFTEFSYIPKCTDVFLYEEQDNERFFELYNKSASVNPLAFERKDTLHFTFDPYKSMLYTYVLTDYSAYVTFSVNRGESTVFVKELAYLNKNALFKIIGFLRSFEGNQKYLSFSKLGENSPIINLISDINKVSFKMSSVGAARVLDVESVLNKREYPESSGRFTVGFTDIIDKNNGAFSVEYDNNNSEIKRVDISEPDVVLNPALASQILLSGIRDVKSLEYSDGIQINRYNPSFFNAFTFRPCFFNDEF